MNNSITILSAMKHSGKTTQLIEWATKRNDIGGIFSPVVDGKRVFMDAATSLIFAMEATSTDTDTLSIGKYIFSKAAFEKAGDIIINAANKGYQWLVIDEIGPLEMQGKGFALSLKKILAQNNSTQKILLVVRNTMVDEAIAYFDLKKEAITIIGIDAPFFQQ